MSIIQSSCVAAYLPNGEVIAVVEAKRQSRDPRVAEQQVRHYVTEIEKHESFRPFAFMSNGDMTFFWDVGNENKRQVAGFFSLRDLQNLLYIRQNKIPLQQLSVNLAIANRTYQQEAIGRVSERFDEGHRRALVVMATGTGKTRTVMALIEVFLRANQARTVLFVADRDALVRQALDDNFKVYLPNEPRDRIRTYNVDYSKRLYVGTLQTLIKCYKKFTPGFFDLVIFDESHRSIYNQFREVVEYFGARIIGLTATPADFIERNTFQVFRCSDGIPTFNYPYRDAVNEGYLVDYSLYQARTRFQREGIRGANLSEEDRNTLIEQGLDPDEIDYEGTELERTVSNKDTLRKQWEEIMEVCHKDESGQYPGKTIVFAVSQDHALRLASVFEEMYPQYPDMVQVITSQMERTDDLIDRFKKEEMPRIAISVDLLDTGVDVPEVVNLVFMKPVHSLIKMQQMIGRGTRSHEACRYLHRLPDGYKEEFLIIDFWRNNFEQDPSEETVTQNLPVAVKIFNTRLKLLELYLNDQQSADCQQVIADLRQQVGQIPLDAFSVQQVYSQVDDAWQDSFWQELTQHKIDFLRTQVAPFLGYLVGVDVAAATFTNKVERLKLEILTDGPKPETLKSIAEDVSRLPNFLFRYSQRQNSANFCLSHRLRTATPEQLNLVIVDLAAQMKNRRSRSRFFDNSKKSFLNELKNNLKTGSYLDICVGYFNLNGWWLIDELIDGFVNSQNNRCRLLIGMKPTKEEYNNKFYEKLIEDVSSVPKMRVVRFANQLKVGEIQLKLVSDVHAKLYLIYQNRSKLPTTAFLGSSNLTYSGLNRSGELNARFDSPEDCQELQGWFNNQWDFKEAIDFSQEFAELILKDESRFRNNIIKELAHFFIEWQVDYLDCEGEIYRLDDYISFNPQEGEHEIDSKFEPFIKNLIDEFGARYIYLPYDNNPNCETLMDILNRDEDSDDYCDRWLYKSLDYLKYLFEKDD